jgi:diguanylate cyclase (GGDEF)-like protein
MIIATLLLLLTLIAVLVRGERSRSESARLRLLVELSSFLQLSASAAEAIEIIPVFGRRLFPAFDGDIRLIRGASGSAELVASWGDRHRDRSDAPRDCEPFDVGSCRALRHTGAQITAVSGHGACAHGATGTASRSLCLPLLAGRDAVGVLTLHARDRAALPSAADLFANGFADQLSLTLANLQRQDTLHTRAVRDPLTGLFNRRCMEESLLRELQRAGRGEAEVGVIVIDVDHFKAFNDAWGHSGGDTVLQQLARMMQNLCREEDLVCRYGGEEFLIVMPNASTDVVRSMAEQLRDHARQLHVHRDGELLGPITISAGTALAPLHGTTLPALIGAADRALYAAKSGGRDRVASPPPQIVAA